MRAIVHGKHRRHFPISLGGMIIGGRFKAGVIRGGSFLAAGVKAAGGSFKAVGQSLKPKSHRKPKYIKF